MFSEIIVSQQEPINRPCAFVGKPKIPSDVATKLCTRRGFGSKQSTRQFLRVFQNTETEPIQHSICRHMALCFAGGRHTVLLNGKKYLDVKRAIVSI